MPLSFQFFRGGPVNRPGSNRSRTAGLDQRPSVVGLRAETAHCTNDGEVGHGPRSFRTNQLDAADHVGTQFPLASGKTIGLEKVGQDVYVGASVETAASAASARQ